MALFGVLPMVPLVILPMVPLVANGTFGLPMVPTVPLGEQKVPLALPLVPMVLPMAPWYNLERYWYTIGTIGRTMNTHVLSPEPEWLGRRTDFPLYYSYLESFARIWNTYIFAPTFAHSNFSSSL